jgi:hypothetical protein
VLVVLRINTFCYPRDRILGVGGPLDWPSPVK